MEKRTFTKEKKLEILKEATAHGVTATYYSWRKKYDTMGEAGFRHGMTPAQLKEIKRLEKENKTLKELLAEKELEGRLKDEAIDAILEDKFTCPRTFLNYKVFDEWVGAMPSSVRSFVNACRNDTETVVNAKQGLRSTAIFDAIHRSLKSGKPEGIKLQF